MGQIRLGLGQVNITGYLRVMVMKTTTPIVVEAEEVYAPPHPATRNVVVPSAGDIDPAIYYVNFYESSDGVALGTLILQIVYDLKNQQVLAERRYYKAGNGGDTDPDVGSNEIVDPYLDGKTIGAVYKEGFRPLVPPGYDYAEYELLSGGGIRWLNGVWGNEEVIVIEITYSSPVPSGGASFGLYSGVVTLTSSTSLGPLHRGKRLKCESNGSVVMVHTLEDVATVPEGTSYYFTQNGGNQNQTKIIPREGQSIAYNNQLWTEMSIGGGEYLRIEKVGSTWEAVLVHANLLMVGERFAATWKDHPNAKPENGALYDGDEWPRMYDFIKNKLPSTHKIIDDNVTSGGYTHPAGKEGLFVIHSTLKKFRLPNTQGWSERGLANFTTYNIDGTRTYDYPGGTQPENVGAHRHFTFHQNGTNNTATPISSTNSPAARQGNGAQISNTNAEYNICPSPGNEPNVGLTSATSGENRVKNVGVIYMRRF